MVLKTFLWTTNHLWKMHPVNGSSDASQILLWLLVNGIRAPCSSFITFCTAVMDYRGSHCCSSGCIAASESIHVFHRLFVFWVDTPLCSEVIHAWCQLRVGAVKWSCLCCLREPMMCVNEWPLPPGFVYCLVWQGEGDVLHPKEVGRGRGSP